MSPDVHAQPDHLVTSWLEEISETAEFAERPTEERLRIAAAILVVRDGIVKTEFVAKRAKVSESTMFRYIDGRDALVEASVDWSWEQINSAISTASFESPLVSNTIDLLVNDFTAVLRMFDDPVGRLAVTVAFAQMRRPAAFGNKEAGAAERRFFARLDALCGHIVGPADASRLSTYIANYAAAVWFSWFVDGADVLHDDYLLGRDRISDGLRAHLQTVGAESPGRAGRPQDAPQ